MSGRARDYPVSRRRDRGRARRPHAGGWRL